MKSTCTARFTRLERLYVFACLFLLLAACSQSQQVAGVHLSAQDNYYQPSPARRVVDIAKESLVVKDRLRGKNLSLNIVYPTTRGSHPVIVFSHGFGGSGEIERPLAEYWASYGYVVILPTHADALSSGKPKRNERPTSGVAWENRAADISFAIDSIDLIENKLSAYKGTMNMQRLAVAGNSFGAYTTVLSSGAIVDTPEGEVNVRYIDRRPKAFLALSPQGRGSWTGLRDGSWDRIGRPIMYATGSEDISQFDDLGPAWRLEAYRFSPTGDKYRLFVEGAEHEDMGGRESKRGPKANVMYNSIRSASLAFFDAYLRDAREAKLYLISNKLEEDSGGIASVQNK